MFKQTINKIPERAFSFVQAGFWMSFCVSVSFAAVYLQTLGYSNGQVGVILALGNIMGIVVSIMLSSWIDSYEKVTAKKLIPWILTLQAISALVLLLIHDQCLAVSLAFIGFIGFCTTINSLNLKLYADADKAGFFIDYGMTRGVGSIAYVIISIALGFLIEIVSYQVLPVIGLGLCALQYLGFKLFSHYAIETETVEIVEKQHCSLVSFFRQNPRYTLFLLGVVLVYFGHSTACNFLINLTRNVGGDTSDMGLINAFKGLVEIPMMFVYARLFKEGKHAMALRIAAVFFEVKLLAFIMAGNVWQLTAAFIFQAPSYALYMSAVVAYVKEKIAFKDSAKAQSLAFTMTTLGGMLASLIGGQLYDHLSVRTTLLAAFAVGFVGALIMFMGTSTHQFRLHTIIDAVKKRFMLTGVYGHN